MLVLTRKKGEAIICQLEDGREIGCCQSNFEK